MWGFSVGVVACFGLLIFLFSFLYVYSSGLAGSLSCVKGVGVGVRHIGVWCLWSW